MLKKLSGATFGALLTLPGALGGAAVAQNHTLYKHPLYDAATDFTPVALIAETPITLLTRKDLPPNNFKEFVSYAKANQAKMQYGSGGAGSAPHLGWRGPQTV